MADVSWHLKIRDGGENLFYWNEVGGEMRRSIVLLAYVEMLESVSEICQILLGLRVIYLDFRKEYTHLVTDWTSLGRSLNVGTNSFTWTPAARLSSNTSFYMSVKI
jgi:hypothetical protein